MLTLEYITPEEFYKAQAEKLEFQEQTTEIRRTILQLMTNDLQVVVKFSYV